MAAEVEAAGRIGVRLIERFDPDYPPGLNNLPDPPAFINVRGDVAFALRPTIGMVGARNASANGRLFAEELAGALAAAGGTIVSGLARGIDTAAHKGALTGEGGTIAVLACGVDVAYPSENAGLLEAVAAHGFAISERPLGAPPLAKHFLKRNRLIAALSLGVVVVEAAERSGSLTTARLAAELGREVMAVPGSPRDPRHAGTNRLLREGAALVTGIEDVEATIAGAVIHRTVASGPSRPVAPRPPPAAAPRPPPQKKPAAAAADLAAAILTHLSAAPVAVDEVIRQCQGSPPDVQDALVELEIDGHILRHPGNRVSRSEA